VKNVPFPGCLLLLILFVMPWSAYPQPVKRTPRLVLQERDFDFGKVKQRSRITHIFTLLNQGDGILEIKKISPD